MPARSSRPRVAIFGPNPLLTVTVEARPDGRDEIHVHAGGQGVWVARMVAEMSAEPVLCAFVGGETGELLRPLLAALPGEQRLVETAAGGGAYVVDRRGGERRAVAQELAEPPTRHELDDLFSTTVAAALSSRALVVCNGYPAEVLPDPVYGALVADVRANGVPVLVDLSSPRLDSALTGRPDLVKINDWELAAYVLGPVSEPEQLRAAAQRLLDAGAGAAIITRAELPALALTRERELEVVPPAFARGAREGCGDSMMGALAAATARGLGWEEALRLGAAAGAVNFLRRGLGTGARPAIEELRERVELRPA